MGKTEWVRKHWCPGGVTRIGDIFGLGTDKKKLFP